MADGQLQIIEANPPQSAIDHLPSVISLQSRKNGLFLFSYPIVVAMPWPG